MKAYKFTLNQGGGFWGAMLQSNHPQGIDLMNHLNDDDVVRPMDDLPVMQFDLMVRRTFTPDYSAYEGVSQEEAMLQFKREYPVGKPLVDEGTSGIFDPIHPWESFSFTELSFFEPPAGMICRIVSNAIKEVLESVSLPPHHFYPIDLVQEISKEVRRYYLFVVYCDVQWTYRNSRWSEMTPRSVNLKSKQLVKQYSKGEGGSFDRFLNDIFMPERAHYLDIMKVDRIVLEGTYDLWRVGPSLIISEGLREKLVASNLQQVIGDYTSGVDVYQL